MPINSHEYQQAKRRNPNFSSDMPAANICKIVRMPSSRQSGINSFQGGTPNALAKRSIFESDTFHRDRSMAETYVRSSSHSIASCSCDHPFSTLRTRTRYANTPRRSSTAGLCFGREGCADKLRASQFGIFASTEFASHVELFRKS